MYEQVRARLSALVPIERELGIRKIWAATIDYTPDHLPILGPALTPDGGAIDGVTVASPGGHGMMWGPGVARVAADLAIRGSTDVIDVTDLGLDRFDEHGRSRSPRTRSRCRSRSAPTRTRRPFRSVDRQQQSPEPQHPAAEKPTLEPTSSTGRGRSGIAGQYRQLSMLNVHV